MNKTILGPTNEHSSQSLAEVMGRRLTLTDIQVLSQILYFIQGNTVISIISKCRARNG
jgi:hypothetical protein